MLFLSFQKKNPDGFEAGSNSDNFFGKPFFV
jgi:hypothetical protein